MIEPIYLYLSAIPLGEVINILLYGLLPIWLGLLLCWGREVFLFLRQRWREMSPLSWWAVGLLGLLPFWFLAARELGVTEWSRINQAWTQSHEFKPLVTLSGLKYFGHYWPILFDISHEPMPDVLWVQWVGWLGLSPLMTIAVSETLLLMLLLQVCTASLRGRPMVLVALVSLGVGSLASLSFVRHHLIAVVFFAAAILLRSPLSWAICTLSRPVFFPLFLVSLWKTQPASRWKMIPVAAALILEIARLAIPVDCKWHVFSQSIETANATTTQGRKVFVTPYPFFLASQRISVLSDDYARKNPRRTEGLVSNFLFDEIVVLK